MCYKLIISKLNLRGKNCIATALYDENKAIEFRISSCEKRALLGNIYVGKVKNIVENIRAAFIEVEDGKICYYPMDEQYKPIFTNPKKDDVLHIGDELIVQVSKEAVSNKAPRVTGNLNFTGKYLVLTSGNTRFGISKKLNGQTKECLRRWLEPFLNDHFGIVVRTNAAQVSKQEILDELDRLKKRMICVLETGNTRTCYSLLYEAPRAYMAAIRDAYDNRLESIVTDDRELYEEIMRVLENSRDHDVNKLVLYDDPLQSLNKRYGIEDRLREALQEKVWLRSGGFLVIQATEAFVAIDVNSGKFSGKKKTQETYRKINLEAEKEIAIQVRLRNLTGIILIDFINLKKDEDKKELLELLQEDLNEDPIYTKVIDMTALNIVEVVRKKVRKPLYQQIADL